MGHATYFKKKTTVAEPTSAIRSGCRYYMKIKKRYIALIIIAIPTIWFLSQCIVWTAPNAEKLKALEGRWEAVLCEALGEVDSLEIIQLPKESLITITDINDISRLINAVEINEEKSGNVCFCVGELELIFRNKTNQVAAINVHKNGRLRWRSGEWINDAILTTSSSNQFFGWMKTHDIK